MKRTEKILLGAAVFLMALPLCQIGSPGQEKEKNTLPLNAEFYRNFAKLPPVSRDEHLEAKINSVILCRGKISSLGKIDRYKKHYRVVCSDRDAGTAGLNITYYVYMDNSDSVDMLAAGALLEFSGQIVAYTPVNTQRTGYILDIIMEKGAIIIE